MAYTRVPARNVVSADITDGTVTLADMANLAQDLFIGRTTASTGVPETATITAAARTVLDDTTVAAMVNTLGGATSVGTGGIVRAILPVMSLTATITAGTTQTQAGATALTKDVNEISVCANANDGVKLPTAVGGQQITIINNGAQTARVWPFSGDDCGAGVDTQITLAAGSVMICTDYDATNWRCTTAAKVVA